MIDAYVARIGPNPLKLVVFLEEVEVAHRKIWLQPGDDFRKSAEFLRISPHGKVPALTDHDPMDGDGSLHIFESAAILFYLADKTQRLLGREPRARVTALQWVAWQVAALGPTSGQAAHFARLPQPGNDYARERFSVEVRRQYRILDDRLKGRSYIAGEYSIADIACFPWIYVHDVVGVSLEPYANLARWLGEMAARPAVTRALAQAMPPKG